MPLINVSVQHGTTLPDATARLDAAVADVRRQFGPMIRDALWNADRTAVTLTGPGVVVDLRVDAAHVHATGDIPLLGKLLGSGPAKALAAGVKTALARNFKKLPGS